LGGELNVEDSNRAWEYGESKSYLTLEDAIMEVSDRLLKGSKDGYIDGCPFYIGSGWHGCVYDDAASVLQSSDLPKRIIDGHLELIQSFWPRDLVKRALDSCGDRKRCDAKVKGGRHE